MRAPPRTRLRLTLLWSAFAIVAVATAFAVHRLYESARREIAEQGERALAQEHSEARERVRARTDTVRHTTIAELAAFHVDGLGHALRQWDGANEIVTGTFEWQPERGFLAGHVSPGTASKAGELPPLWQRFREWRTKNPTATRFDVETIASFRTNVVRMLDNTAFAANELGYQGENLDMLTYAGRAADPWAGWAARSDDPDAPWIFWYQAGPDATVRGCFVDVAPLVKQIRADLAERRLARLELVADRDGALGRAGGATSETLSKTLPGYTLAANLGDVFVEKQSNARFAAATVALLFALVLLGVAFLVNISRREARDAERKTTFVSQVSHELRTPLTSIRMFADMLATPGLSEEKRAKFAGTISRESQRLGALIERLLTFNALEKGRRPTSIALVDVTALVHETVEEMEATVQEAGMKIVTDISDDAMRAMTDRSSVKQALLNLVDNAVKYAREGKVVSIALEETNDLVRLRVCDRGPGIALALRGRVFEPFVQGGQTLTDKSPGVGLGLSIARGLMRAVGGDLVLLFSERGAAFEIRLPKNPSPTS